jgi:hypothetical protein
MTAKNYEEALAVVVPIPPPGSDEKINTRYTQIVRSIQMYNLLLKRRTERDKQPKEERKAA